MKSFALSLFQSVVQYWRGTVEAQQVVYVEEPEQLEASEEQPNSAEPVEVTVLGRVGFNIRRLLQENTLRNSVLMIEDGCWPSPLGTVYRPLPFYFCNYSVATEVLSPYWSL